MSKSILVVDDSDVTRKITRLFLEVQVGLEVCGEAVDGVDAIEKAKKLKPDLILLDVAMPRMNGIKAASERFLSSARRIFWTIEPTAPLLHRCDFNFAV